MAGGVHGMAVCVDVGHALDFDGQLGDIDISARVGVDDVIGDVDAEDEFGLERHADGECWGGKIGLEGDSAEAQAS